MTYYLGIPISNETIRAADLIHVKLKIRKRLAMWQCKYPSHGGKTALMDSCLNLIPLYTMGFYLLPENLHDDIDSDRANFF